MVLSFLPPSSPLEDTEDTDTTMVEARWDREAGERTTPPTTPEEAQQVEEECSLELLMCALCLDLSRTGDVEAMAPAEAKEDGPLEDATEELDAAKTFFYFLNHCG
jgi:hypothetical protein